MAFAPRNSAPKTTRRQRDLPRRAAPTPKTKHRPVRETKPKLGLGAVARLGAARRGRSRWRRVVWGAELRGAKAIIRAQRLPAARRLVVQGGLLIVTRD